MASLQVRDFPLDLYEELKTRARQEHRSISQQTIIALREHVAEGMNKAQPISFAPTRGFAAQVERESRVERRRKVLAEIHALPKVKIPDDFPSSVEILREARGE
jgi:plasmid stability protein